MLGAVVLQVAALAEVLGTRSAAWAWAFSGVRSAMMAAMLGPYCVYWILAQKARSDAPVLQWKTMAILSMLSVCGRNASGYASSSRCPSPRRW